MSKKNKQAAPERMVLVLATLVNRQSVLFGVKVNAGTAEGARVVLLRKMTENNGQTLIPAVHLQVFSEVQMVICGECDNITPADSMRCSGCGLGFDTDQMKESIIRGKSRVVVNTKYDLRAEKAGTINEHHIRPCHIVMYDVVPEESPAFEIWQRTAAEAVERMTALRSSIELPNVADVLKFGGGGAGVPGQ